MKHAVQSVKINKHIYRWGEEVVPYLKQDHPVATDHITVNLIKAKLRNAQRDTLCFICKRHIYPGWLYAPFAQYPVCLVCVRPREEPVSVPVVSASHDTQNATGTPPPRRQGSSQRDLNDARRCIDRSRDNIGDAITHFQANWVSKNNPYAGSYLIGLLQNASTELDDAADSLGRDSEFIRHRWDWFEDDEIHVLYSHLISHRHPRWEVIENFIEEIEDEMSRRGEHVRTGQLDD